MSLYQTPRKWWCRNATMVQVLWGMANALLLFALACQIARNAPADPNELPPYEIVVFAPLLMGSICAYFWSGLRLSAGQILLGLACCTLIDQIIAYGFMGDRADALLAGSPVMLLFICVGEVLTRRVLESRRVRVKT